MSKLAPVPTNSSKISKGQKDVIMEGFAGDDMFLICFYLCAVISSILALGCHRSSKVQC